MRCAPSSGLTHRCGSSAMRNARLRARRTATQSHTEVERRVQTPEDRGSAGWCRSKLGFREGLGAAAATRMPCWGWLVQSRAWPGRNMSRPGTWRCEALAGRGASVYDHASKARLLLLGSGAVTNEPQVSVVVPLYNEE